LQLNITVNNPAADQYTWLPGTGLSSTSIPNPVADLFGMSGKTIVYTVTATTADGCYGQDDIKVTVFATAPDIFVPNAFTPNGDNVNDVLRPIGVGISKLNFFRVYNRWGQLVFSTTDAEHGWDGTFNGRLQGTDTFVFVTQGIDYTGKTITKKGTVTLIN